MRPQHITGWITRRSTAFAALGVIVLLGAGTLSPTAIASSGPSLVKDIDTSGSSEPTWLTDLNGILLFAARGGGKGVELWRSDGTATGTRRVKDIRPGSAGSRPFALASIGGRLYFSADDGVHGHELWISDGTAAGTRMVKDINPGSGASDPGGFAAHKGFVYFAAEDAARGRELWRTDGTSAGTKRVKDIVVGSGSSSPNELVSFTGKLFFVTSVGMVDSQETLYSSDGTAARTQPLRDSTAKIITDPEIDWLTVAGDRLFFVLGRDELWRSRGSASTTKRIASMPIGELTPVGSRVFFDSSPESLWKSDGTVASTGLVKTFESLGPAVVFARELDGARLAFFSRADDGLWVSNGTTGGTQTIAQALTSVEPATLTSVVYFAGYTVEEWNEWPVPSDPPQTLWRTDGTALGTYSVGGPPAQMDKITAVGGTIYFVSNAGGIGRELWRYVP